MRAVRSYARAVSEWVWFVIAGLAAAGGGALLAVDGGRHSAHQRERRRWAALRGWRFVLSDPVLADRWRHGVIARGGAGLAKDLVIGSLFTPLGRRAVQIFDHEQGGQVSSVVVAVQRRVHTADLVAELWMPDQPLPQDPGLSMLGPVGDRVALVNEQDRIGPLTSPEFVRAANALGNDIPVAWLEQDWVLAAAPCSATPTRLERLLRVLDEIADLLDAADLDRTPEPAEFFRPGQ
ncbi:MAG: hypothetical protein QOH09_2877 [Pseudonocardiales bacterium]|jgi:hypothetical protein|nr:hypothetical protein [Pseudonocardiales bacterium]MDT7716885.1 hypothetical protein [Pseudonocardiales bacterium]